MAETTNGMLRKEIGQLKAELQKTSNGKYWVGLLLGVKKKSFQH